ncbi:uncharacterized protein A4U43_C07F21570 [Asparagus officinalis]|uniref:Uncharacterized protein n=1 Tax=Asparagus officinalis TaxID=4686 RepID=A0A5P1EGV1_ASPOF|nr:uncharacterized protein A4U43_C07F21570 [Asparagus officinalis]
MNLKINTTSAKLLDEIEDEPVSPQAQYLNSSVLYLSILAVFELEIPIDDSQAFSTLENLLLPINPRFSSIMVKDEHGTPRWKRVQINLEDHIKVPMFPPGLELYDDYLQEYIVKIATNRLPEDKPLWNIHIIKYPTKNAAGSLVFQLHHSLGDGFSLMTALLHCVKRADNPSLPLTYPSNENSQARKRGVYRFVSNFFPMCINTVKDFSWSLMMSTVMKDSTTPIRSGDVGIENRPITLSTVTFSLSDIKQIKTKLKGTVNDAITGIIFYGIQLYLQAVGQEKKPAKVTALVLLNTRATRTYLPIKEMARHDSKVPWGNHYAFLHISVPMHKDPKNLDPLNSIEHAKKIIKAKRNSLGVYLTAATLDLMRKFKGPEAVSRQLYNTLSNTSMAITSMVGPIEKVQIANHPIKSFYFAVTGSPQSLTITVISYMGMIRVVFGAERDFINSELLVSCMEKSFERISEEAVGKRA